MKTFLKILSAFLGLIAIVIITYKFFYYQELRQIKECLNSIQGVKVLNIWGHDDITLEEVSARLKIKDKGEIVLGNLSEDVFNYPQRVSVEEIGGYSFTWFSCNGGIGSSIDIGTEGELGKSINISFKSPEDVVRNYDKILKVVKDLKKSPEITHLETPNSEIYLLVENKNSIDQDKLYYLVGIENKFEFAKTLKWNRSDCYYNKK
jgi:hypothetical protein